ncbi:MAG: DUF2332 domain-containing protein [Pontixanthobacter sp.]
MANGPDVVGADYGGVMDIKDIPAAIEWQAEHAARAGATGTARILRGLLAVLDTDTAVRRRMTQWEELTLQDAMPLRIHGGLHHLLLSGKDRRLEPVYAGLKVDQKQIDNLVSDLVRTYDRRLLPWLDGPPQTNEAGRSWAFMAALFWLSERVGSRFALHEIGASAGVNTMMDRYRFDLGGVMAGPHDAMIRIDPEWRGPPPPDAPVSILSTRGCDRSPIDLTDPAAALRLKSYVWPEAAARMARIEAAARLAQKQAPDLVKQDAAAFVHDMLGTKPEEGVARVLCHSIVWQYLPEDTRASIRRDMELAGEAATEDTPLAWVSLETDRKTFAHELHVRYWPGGGATVKLGCGHPHGAWAEWFGV